jgi:glycosyl transferase family 25
MLKNIYYINLADREDRKNHIESEFRKLGWDDVTRLDAIRNKDGRVGCALSHLKILTIAKEKELPYVAIFEDDAQIVEKQRFKKIFTRIMEIDINYDVYMLAGNIRGETKQIAPFTHTCNKAFCGTAYIVKKHYYDTLINTIKNGILGLMKHPKIRGVNEIDTCWFKLQSSDNWVIMRPRMITQLASYSDIENRNVSYHHLMLDNYTYGQKLNV